MSKGFTLIELMIVVAIVAVLAAIALPAYQDYVIRGRLTEAFEALQSQRVRMEQYMLDNRNYSTTSTGTTCPFASFQTPNTASFMVRFACSSTLYTITASGQATSPVPDFRFTIDQANARVTAAVPAGWSLPATNCWVTKKGGVC